MKLGKIETRDNETVLRLFNAPQNFRQPRRRRKAGRPRTKRAKKINVVTPELAKLNKRKRYEARQLQKGLCRSGCGNKLNQWKYRCDTCQKKEHTRWLRKHYAPAVSRTSQKPQRATYAERRREERKSRQKQLMRQLQWYEKQNWDPLELLQQWKRNRRRLPKA